MQRLALQAGTHAQEFHDWCVRHAKPKEIQFDEVWDFMRQFSRRTKDLAEQLVGDSYASTGGHLPGCA